MEEFQGLEASLSDAVALVNSSRGASPKDGTHILPNKAPPPPPPRSYLNDEFDFSLDPMIDTRQQVTSVQDEVDAWEGRLNSQSRADSRVLNFDSPFE